MCVVCWMQGDDIVQANDAVDAADPMDDTQWIVWQWVWWELGQGVVDIEL